MTEQMVVSETGGKKARKPQQIHRLDPMALAYVAEVASWGGAKYDLEKDADHYNYLKGFPWSDTYDAGQRHQMLHWSGEDLDPESNLLHLGHAAWHALCQLSFALRGIGTDDRPKDYQRGPATTVAEPPRPKLVRDRSGDLWVQVRDNDWYLLGVDEDPEEVLREGGKGHRTYAGLERAWGPLTPA
jgi:hypothetical protein